MDDKHHPNGRKKRIDDDWQGLGQFVPTGLIETVGDAAKG